MLMIPFIPKSVGGDDPIEPNTQAWKDVILGHKEPAVSLEIQVRSHYIFTNDGVVTTEVVEEPFLGNPIVGHAWPFRAPTTIRGDAHDTFYAGDKLWTNPRIGTPRELVEPEDMGIYYYLIAYNHTSILTVGGVTSVTQQQRGISVRARVKTPDFYSANSADLNAVILDGTYDPRGGKWRVTLGKADWTPVGRAPDGWDGDLVPSALVGLLAFTNEWTTQQEEYLQCVTGDNLNQWGAWSEVLWADGPTQTIVGGGDPETGISTAIYAYSRGLRAFARAGVFYDLTIAQIFNNYA